MGPKKNINKQSSSSASNRSSASAGFKILKGAPQNPEDYMEETDDVNRDELATDVGAHIPASEASFVEEENFEEEEEEAPSASFPRGTWAPDSEEEGEVITPDPMEAPDIRNATLQSLEHRFRETLRSFQRFICNHYRIDETIELTNAYLRKGSGSSRSELVEKNVLKIEDVWLSTEELIQQLDEVGSLTETQKRQLSETNGHLVTLRAILRVDSDVDIDGNFIRAGGFVSTPGFNKMIQKISQRLILTYAIYQQRNQHFVCLPISPNIPHIINLQKNIPGPYLLLNP